MVNETKLFIIRHGQTDWNLAGKLQGQADIPLNETGIAQAQKVGQFLKDKVNHIDALYTSDLQRAHQTAFEISKLFSLEVVATADLRERHFGKIQGLTKKEMYDKYGLTHHDDLPEALGAEPQEKLLSRLMKFLTFAAEKHKGKNVALITHGATMRSLLAHLGNSTQEVSITNGSIITFTWHPTFQPALLLKSIDHI